MINPLEYCNLIGAGGIVGIPNNRTKLWIGPDLLPGNGRGRRRPTIQVPDCTLFILYQVQFGSLVGSKSGTLTHLEMFPSPSHFLLTF